MKILLASHFFHPSVGGIEEVSRVLASEFTTAGHDVRVVTATREDDGTRFPFQVHRHPSPAALLELVRWCDVFFQNNISLQTAWPLAIVRRPWVIAHHTWIARTDGRRGWRDRLKHSLSTRAQNIAVSNAIASHLSAPAAVIGNPYRHEVFRLDPAAQRDLDLVFVGRLVRDKGVDLLLDALKTLPMRLTIVGRGPEESALRAQCERLGLGERVVFAGMKADAELAALLNRHRVIVIPSRWEEPFGLVALEGIACGCVAAGSRGGGLPDAIGACGVTFARNDPTDMARVLAELWRSDLKPFRDAAPEHLARHSARTVAGEYLRVLEEAAR